MVHVDSSETVTMTPSIADGAEGHPEINAFWSRWDDEWGMTGFLGRWLERIHPRDGVDPSIRTAFEQALEIEGRITLIQPDLETGETVTYRAMLERLDDDSFLVLAPDNLPARVGDVFEMAVLGRSGRHCGMVELIGHEQVPSGGQHPIPGLRFSYPPSLDHNERRRAHRVSVAFDLAPRGRIFDGRTSGPVEVSILDLSIGGMQLKCNAHADRFSTGQTIDLDVNLPDPVGSMLIPARIASIRDDESGQQRLGIAFTQAVEGMAQLVRSIEVRRAGRRRTERV